MVDVQYARGFTDALEYVMAIFNRLSRKGMDCKDCRLMGEIAKLRLFAKDKEFEKIENELGYILP